jgi:hypothetical protein
LITVKYYWGERGAPPMTGGERKRQKREELELRAQQIELLRQQPRELRSDSFWDNTQSKRAAKTTTARK